MSYVIVAKVCTVTMFECALFLLGLPDFQFVNPGQTILASAKRERLSPSHTHHQVGVRGFLPRKIFEILDARTCVLACF